MSNASVTCACGKTYAWKPQLAGKRAKCKCGNVISFAAAPSVEDELPPLPDDYDAADVPPPPPMHAASAPVLPPPVRGTLPTSDSAKRGGFVFSWKALLNLVIGLAIFGFGVYLFMQASEAEAAGKTFHMRGRRTGLINLIYSIGGKWGLLGVFGLIGVCMIGGSVLVMMGKRAPSEE